MMTNMYLIRKLLGIKALQESLYFQLSDKTFGSDRDLKKI